LIRKKKVRMNWEVIPLSGFALAKKKRKGGEKILGESTDEKERIRASSRKDRAKGRQLNLQRRFLRRKRYQKKGHSSLGEAVTAVAK